MHPLPIGYWESQFHDHKFVDEKEKLFDEEISRLSKIENGELGLVNFGMESKFVNECFRLSRIEVENLNLANFSLYDKFCGEISRLSKIGVD